MNISQLIPVLEIFRHRLIESMSIRQIAKLLKLSYEPAYRRVKQMEKNGYLKKKNEKYKINLKNNTVIKILELLADKEKEKTLKKYKKLESLNRLINFSEESTGVFYIILFGSYAKGKPTQKSDIDLLVALEEERFKTLKKQIETIFSFIKETYISEKYKISPIFAQSSDIKEMINERKSIMLDIIKEGIVLFGEKKYYKDLAKYLKEW